MKPYKEDHFRHCFADIRTAAGLDPDLRFMDLRRTAGTRLGDAGCTLHEIRAITGHLSLQVVARYVRPTTTQAEAAMRKLKRNQARTKTGPRRKSRPGESAG
jgi:hypothetical protein